jgi:PAS domain S-box-containing protein
MPDEFLSALQPAPEAVAVGDGVCITDESGVFLRVNAVFCRLHGRSESELVGRSASVLAEGVDRPQFGTGYVDLIRGALGERIELRLPLPGDASRQLVARAFAMVGMAGGRFTVAVVKISEIVPERGGGFIGFEPGLGVLAAAGDGIVGTDLSGVIDTFNSGAESLFGYSAAEVIGANVSVLMPEPYRQHHDRYMAEAREGVVARGRERQRRLVGRRKDGSVFPLLLLLGERPAGETAGYLAVLLHDGDHEMNRASLEQTSARLYDALGSLKEGFLLCDARDRVVVANARMRSLFPEVADLILPGRTFADLVRSCAERGLYDPGTVGLETWIRERVARHRQLPNQFEIDICGGRRIEVRELATAEGACVTVYDDITERHHRERQLRDREVQLSVAQRIAKLGGWRVDVATGNISWSQEMYRLFGVDPEAFSLSPEAVFSVIHVDDRERVRRLLTTPGRRRAVREWEFRIIRPSGEERVLWAESQSERNARGDLVSHFGVCQDITARKLDQLALVQAKEAAELASRSKSQFLANMSHELRTPLNAIIGFSEMMASEVLGPLGSKRYREYAEAVLNSGNHLLELINEVLDLSKIEAGRYDLSEEWLCLREVFQDALVLVGPRAAEKGTTTTISDAGDFAPQVFADRRALRQMLLNLLSNAVKFTPAGGRVAMRAVWDFAGLRLEVADTGVGIPPERVRELAQPFVQIDNAMNRRHAGSGIGLYLTRSLVELHGGKLDISSRQGAQSGTTVTLIFPVERLRFHPG